MKLQLQNIKEGNTNLIVPKVKKTKGPATSKVPVFYNPAMEFNRDVSVLAMNNILKSAKKGTCFRVLDGLAGTGIRGVRFANEVEGIEEVVINDRNPSAFDLIKKNIKLNNLKNSTATNEKFNVILINNRNRFDYIDIDPFGTPVEFIEQSCRAIRDKGIIAVTATDTATLCGRYPKTCLRRYDAITIKTSYRHELGIRVLIGYCTRQASKYDLALTPTLIHSTDHYYRVYFSARKGVGRADKSIKNLGYIWHDPETGNRGFSPEPIPELSYAGPLWTNNLFDNIFLKKLDLNVCDFGTKRRLTKMLAFWLEEAEAPALFYEINELASKFKISPPKMEKALNSLREEGYAATRTHFSPQGFRTDASVETMKNIF